MMNGKEFESWDLVMRKHNAYLVGSAVAFAALARFSSKNEYAKRMFEEFRDNKLRLLDKVEREQALKAIELL